MKNCLVTGATGLIGMSLVQLLLDKGWEVHITFRNVDKKPLPNNIKKYCNCIEHDFSLENKILKIPDNIDAIVHLAQEEEYRDFPDSSMKIFNVNITSTMRLLEFARKSKVRSFILASSGGVYKPGTEKVSEDSYVYPDKDLSFYLGSKFCAEILAQNYAAFMNIIRLRFFFVYGSNQKRNMLIPRLIHNIQQGIPVMLQGENGIHINPIYVEDAVQAIYSALNIEKSDVFNVAGTEDLSLKDIACIIGNKIKKDPIYKVCDEHMQKSIIADIEKMKKYLYVPKITFEMGIDKLIREGN